jgi:predicted transcriptional regulator
MGATKTTKPRTATAIRFPDELHDELVRAAEERDLSINYLVVRAVEDYLPRLIPADEFSLTRPA